MVWDISHHKENPQYGFNMKLNHHLSFISKQASQVPLNYLQNSEVP